MGVCARTSTLSPSPELERSLLQAYARTFIARTDLYPIQQKEGSYRSVKKPLTLRHVADHLKGRTTLGAYALDANSQARWLCLDADDNEQWFGVLRLTEKLHRQNITPYIETSRRGGHLWLFFSPMTGESARTFGKCLLKQSRFEGIELYPKQDVLKTGPGSLVRLPLGIHRKTGRRYHFITLDGVPLAPTIREQVRHLTSPKLVPDAFIRQVLQESKARQPASLSPTFARPSIPVEGATVSERIKNRISVYDFVSQYVELDARNTGFCPFHDDTHKSFGVNAEGNFWHCWAGCGGGSVIDFWMLWRTTHGQEGSFKATITDLANLLL